MNETSLNRYPFGRLNIYTGIIIDRSFTDKILSVFLRFVPAGWDGPVSISLPPALPVH
jgi:hypothetical protein